MNQSSLANERNSFAFCAALSPAHAQDVHIARLIDGEIRDYVAPDRPRTEGDDGGSFFESRLRNNLENALPARTKFGTVGFARGKIIVRFNPAAGTLIHIRLRARVMSFLLAF